MMCFLCNTILKATFRNWNHRHQLHPTTRKIINTISTIVWQGRRKAAGKSQGIRTDLKMYDEVPRLSISLRSGLSAIPGWRGGQNAGATCLLQFWVRVGSLARGGEGCASQGGSAIPRRRAQVRPASCPMDPHPRKIRLISWGSMSLVSDIKLIRTDTTLDLSQKAEKGIPLPSNIGHNISHLCPMLSQTLRDNRDLPSLLLPNSLSTT